MRSIVGLSVAALLLCSASDARADRIEVLAATTDMGSGRFHSNTISSLDNTINGMGLSAVTLTASHLTSSFFDSWVSADGIPVGQVTFDFGGPVSLKGFSFWNLNAGSPRPAGSTGIQGVNVLVSIDGVTFSPLPGAPSTFARVSGFGPVGPEMFSFSPVMATLVRFQILSNYGDASQSGFSEVGFDGDLVGVRATATYDAALKAPKCATPSGSCDSRGLLVGRGTLFSGPEPNQPNTIHDSCADGTGGQFHLNESIDRLTVSTLDGGMFAPGKTVRIATTVWAFNSSDQLDLYYAPDAAAPSWTYITTLTPTGPGAQTLSAFYVLPAGAVQAVRASFRFLGTPSACPSGVSAIYDDRDDLAFRVGQSAADFDGDGKDDPTVFRPTTAGWYHLNSSTNFTSSGAHVWGASTDTVVPGDFDGDGKIDPAVFRPSTGGWYVLQSSTNYTTSTAVIWGIGTDIPVPGDYDGDGKTDAAVFRPSTGGWYFLKSSTGYTSSGAVIWGASTDIPVQGDYDGDGKADPAVFRPSTGGWYFLNSSTNFTSSGAAIWGIGTDIAVPGDYDGDGKTDPAVLRPSTGGWYFLKSSTSFTTSGAVIWGVGTDVPVPGDYDGDGKTDPAVFRPSTGGWYGLKSSTNFTSSFGVVWGIGTDTPINKRP